MSDRREEVRQLLRATARMLAERERTGKDWQVGKIYVGGVDDHVLMPMGWATFHINFTMQDVNPEIVDLLTGRK